MGLLLVPVLYLVPVARLLPIRAISQSDAKWTIFYLGFSVLLGQLEQLMSAAYTCVARYPYGTFVKNMISLTAFAATMVPVVLGYGPRTAALVFFVANGIGTVTLGLFVRKDIPWIEFGWKHAHFSEIRRLAPLAFAFMGFPHWLRAQPAGNPDRCRLCAGTDRCGDLRHRAHRLAGGAADGADGEHHLLARVCRWRTAQKM